MQTGGGATVDAVAADEENGAHNETGLKRRATALTAKSLQHQN